MRGINDLFAGVNMKTWIMKKAPYHRVNNRRGIFASEINTGIFFSFFIDFGEEILSALSTYCTLFYRDFFFNYDLILKLRSLSILPCFINPSENRKYNEMNGT